MNPRGEGGERKEEGEGEGEGRGGGKGYISARFLCRIIDTIKGGIGNVI